MIVEPEPRRTSQPFSRLGRIGWHPPPLSLHRKLDRLSAEVNIERIDLFYRQRHHGVFGPRIDVALPSYAAIEAPLVVAMKYLRVVPDCPLTQMIAS